VHCADAERNGHGSETIRHMEPVGVFATPGTAFRLHHPEVVGTLIGSATGRIVARTYGWRGNRSREVPGFESQPSRCSAVGLWD
jgi:hypothetical protein